MYVHGLKFYLSHLSLYQFGDFYVWCEASICFIFSPFSFSLCGYLIILAPFIEKIVFPHCSRMPLQHKSNISLCLSLCLVFLFCLIGSLVSLSISAPVLQLSFNKSWDLVEQVFLPYSSIVSNPPLVFYTSQCILESSCQVPREKINLLGFLIGITLSP